LCDDNCLNEAAAGSCDHVVVLQNRGNIYATIDGANALSWVQGAATEGDAEVFVRESTSCGFTLKSISNGNFVEIQNNKLSATGATGVVINTEWCGTNPVGFGALRVDTNADGNAFNHAGNYWKSNGIIGLTGGCAPESTTSWEKFQVVVTATGVDCAGPTPTCSDGIQNQGEERVDCGFPCPNDCPGYCGDGIVDTELGEECDDGNNVSCDSCADNCLTEPEPGICDHVVVLQNRDDRYTTLDGENALSWEQGAEAEGDAEVFIRKSTSWCGFTLKSMSNGNFVEIQNNKLSATGATGVVIQTEACGADPVGFGALRVDTDDDGDAFNDDDNFWKSNDSIGLTGGCSGDNGSAWEKFQVVLILADVDCDGTFARQLRGPITSGSLYHRNP
jgi:cysteine-rich repeat protein